MYNTDKMPMWRKITIAICSLIIIVCIILLFNINRIIKYDYKNVDEWHCYGDEKSHIGNISCFDSRGEFLEDNWVNIGNRYWYSNDIEDVYEDKEFGDLIQWYSYRINDSSNPHYGEKASLWIYDISDRMKYLRMTKNTFYKYIHDKYANDTTSSWNNTNEFKPFIALYTKPSASFYLGDDTKGPVYHERFMIFANYRIYLFGFENDKFSQKGMEGFNAFHRRCKNVIDDIDFISYSKWERYYDEFNTLSDKQDKEREQWSLVLYCIIFICCIIIFVLSLRTIGKENRHARIMSYYVIACLTVGLIIMAIKAFDSPSPYKSDTLEWLVLAFVPSFIIYMFILYFLFKKSRIKYETFYLIPDKAIKYLNLKTEYRKRLALLFIFYPLFLIVPLPVLGLIFCVYYILPIIVIILLFIVINKAFRWLKEGKSIDSKQVLHNNNKARLYCRHCGKLIDADSEYCRYCGKRL